ncbi:MAG: hypothetical protein GYA61_01830 [Spirochaetales bacterium]|nr:hypothetical protein [Exilispira sp.]NMC66943.1 hypothetical protein [Spirochaetales bacterium]
MKKCLFIMFSLIILLFFSAASSCSTTTTTTTTSTTTNDQQTQQTQTTETKENEPEILKEKEYQGITYENIPSNVDLQKLTEELTSFFKEYEETVLSKNYDKWLTMISEKYKQKYGDPKSLEKLKLTLYGIYTLKDFFYNVVYQSRIQLNQGKPLQIYKVSFVDSITKAVVNVKFEEKLLTYFFIYENNSWKIGVPEDFE